MSNKSNSRTTALPSLSSEGRTCESISRPPIPAVIFARRSPPSVSPVFDTYWRFAAIRQNVYFGRVFGAPAPWTCDPILNEYKFTNAYRASDRVSQFLIQRVIYEQTFDVRETIFRILLFKFFNKIETWELLERAVGTIVEEVFDVDHFDRILTAELNSGKSIYSAAYIMPSGPASVRRPRKHRMHLELIADVLRNSFPERIAQAGSMAEGYQLLKGLPGIGPFLAYQFITDINYSRHFEFSEMEFVVPGPGARDGIRKCFLGLGDYSETDVIRWMAERQDIEFAKRDPEFRSLWGRPLQLIDCQNLFCEVDKYARVAHADIAGISGRTRIKQRFVTRGSIEAPWFPPKWGLNENITSQLTSRGHQGSSG